MGYIYIIKNELLNKIYVGQTTASPYLRFAGHLFDVDRKDTPLYKDIKTLGINYFQFKVLEEVEDDCLDEREQFWIEYFNTIEYGYNNLNAPKSKQNSDDSLFQKGTLVLNQYTKDNRFIETYKSAREAANTLFPELSEEEQKQKEEPKLLRIALGGNGSI